MGWIKCLRDFVLQINIRSKFKLKYDSYCFSNYGLIYKFFYVSRNLYSPFILNNKII